MSKLHQDADGSVCIIHFCLTCVKLLGKLALSFLSFFNLRFLICFLVIKDWSISAPHSHLAGGMTYKDGKLTVPTTGRYHIYAQFYYHNDGRVQICVNNNGVTMLQPKRAGTGQGTLYAGGVFNLKAGDYITLLTSYTTKIFMWSEHSYFGAFLV